MSLIQMYFFINYFLAKVEKSKIFIFHFIFFIFD